MVAEIAKFNPVEAGLDSGANISMLGLQPLAKVISAIRRQIMNESNHNQIVAE